MSTAVGDVYQARIFCRLGNQVGLNIRHWKVSAMSAGAASEQAFADSLSNSLSTNYRILLCATATYFGLMLDKLTGGVWVNQAVTKQGAGFGSAAGEPLPSQVSSIITLKTGFPGRSQRGRAYVPFAAESDNVAVSGGVPTPQASYVTALANLASKYLSVVIPIAVPLTNITIGGVLFHRATHTNTDLFSVTAQNRWATQRRRGAYGAANADPF